MGWTEWLRGRQPQKREQEPAPVSSYFFISFGRQEETPLCVGQRITLVGPNSSGGDLLTLSITARDSAMIFCRNRRDPDDCHLMNVEWQPEKEEIAERVGWIVWEDTGDGGGRSCPIIPVVFRRSPDRSILVTASLNRETNALSVLNPDGTTTTVRWKPEGKDFLSGKVTF